MNENEVDPGSANGEESPSYPGNELNDEEDYRLEVASALRRKYSGRWAAKKWLLRRYLHCCLSSLTGWFRTVEAAKEDPDDLPF